MMIRECVPTTCGGLPSCSPARTGTTSSAKNRTMHLCRRGRGYVQGRKRHDQTRHVEEQEPRRRGSPRVGAVSLLQGELVAVRDGEVRGASPCARGVLVPASWYWSSRRVAYLATAPPADRRADVGRSRAVTGTRMASSNRVRGRGARPARGRGCGGAGPCAGDARPATMSSPTVDGGGSRRSMGGARVQSVTSCGLMTEL